MSIKKSGIASRHANLDRFLYQYSGFAFMAFFGLAIWGFWTSYYGKLHADMAWSMRFHGLTMTGWCLMLIGQALLIRFKKDKIHKLTGKISYVLVPLIIISGIQLSHITVSGMEQGQSYYYYFIALMFNSLVAFALLFGLAMWHRKSPLTHARYMVCTIFPLFTPITDRLIYKYFRELIPFAPTLEGMPMVQMLGFAFADFLLLILLVWDWKSHKRLDIFPVALLILLLYQISVALFYKIPLWRQVGDWVMQLPIS